MSDGKATATADPKSNSQTPEATEPELVLNSVGDVTAQIEVMRRSDASGPGALSKRKGLKTTAALDGMDTALLMLLAAASLRQIAVNCGEDQKEFNKHFKLLGDYAKVLPTEISSEIRLDKYAAFAEEYGVTRNPGESADDFIGRIKKAIVSSTK